jgi:DNA-directed RNA polymerase specialized sigma24 family protein
MNNKRAQWNKQIKGLWQSRKKLVETMPQLATERTKINYDAIPKQTEKIRPQLPQSKADMTQANLKRTTKSDVKNRSYVNVTSRDIALMFAKHSGFTDWHDIERLTDDYLKSIKKMPKNQILALKMAYVFSSRLPIEDRQDMFQELFIALFQARVKDEKLAYTITRCNWVDFYRGYERKQNMYGGSLDTLDLNDIELIENQNNDIAYHSDMPDRSSMNARDKRTIREYLTGALEYEQIDSDIDTHKFLKSMPKDIRSIVVKRMSGDKLENKEYKRLDYWVKIHPKVTRKIITYCHS